MQVESCVQAAISEYLGRSWNAALADLLSQGQILFVYCPSNRLSWVHIASKR